ncbi:MAG: LCP family protein [Caldisericia bacterium]
MDGYKIDLPSGFHHLNGSMALQYVRFRSDKYADWAAWEGEVKGRSARQTKFVKAIIKEMTKPSNWGKIPTAVGVVMENVQTDLPMEEIYTFAEILRHIDTESIKDVAFSGKPGYVPSFYYKNGQKVDFNMSVIIPNLNELKNLGQEYFSDVE